MRASLTGDGSDGTLLTNRFHMARIRALDEELSGKGGVIGWYKWVERSTPIMSRSCFSSSSLISAMRAQDVQPIAIWDQRGNRQWKAAEVCRFVFLVQLRTKRT